MTITDITPEHLRCSYGGCASVHVLDDGRLLIVGLDVIKHPDLLGLTIPPPPGLDVGEGERAVVIPQDYFSELPELVRLRKRVADLEARLEIDHHFELIGGEMTRVEVPSEDREIGSTDGISCRDATIALQDEHIVKLKTDLAAQTRITDACHSSMKEMLARIEELEGKSPSGDRAVVLQGNGHGAICPDCGEPCDALAGNPGKWPVVQYDGRAVYYHVGCIGKMRAWYYKHRARAALSQGNGQIPFGDRAVVNEAPSGLHPDGLPSLLQAEELKYLRARLHAIEGDYELFAACFEALKKINDTSRIALRDALAAFDAHRERDQSPKGGDGEAGSVHAGPVPEGNSPAALSQGKETT